MSQAVTDPAAFKQDLKSIPADPKKSPDWLLNYVFFVMNENPADEDANNYEYFTSWDARLPAALGLRDRFTKVRGDKWTKQQWSKALTESNDEFLMNTAALVNWAKLIHLMAQVKGAPGAPMNYIKPIHD